MNRLILAVVVACTPLAACERANDGLGGSGVSRGRYVGVGHYSPGQMWTQIAGVPSSKDPAAARPDDDEQVIIVMDSLTGEVRQCGNLSGRCVGLNPWSKGAAGAPIALMKHAEELAADVEQPTITLKAQ
jgi:hypothetical protein